MQDLSKFEQFGIEAVARHYSAHWQIGSSPPDAYVTVNGRQIALDVAIIAPPPGARTLSKARLREDVVARRVLRDIERALNSQVPNRKAIILTLGAPIKVPKKLIVAVTKLLSDYIQSGTPEREERRTVLGNRIRFRLLHQNPKWNAKVSGFVFSGDPRPGFLADVIRSLHDAIAAKASRQMPRSFRGDRWLVLSSDDRIADIKTYRRIYSQLSVPRTFKKILMVLDGGRVAPLAEI